MSFWTRSKFTAKVGKFAAAQPLPIDRNIRTSEAPTDDRSCRTSWENDIHVRKCYGLRVSTQKRATLFFRISYLSVVY